MARSVGFWNFIAKKYAKSPIGDPAAYEVKLEKTREHLTPQSEVFEFGCGTGSTALTHAPSVQHISAVDYSKSMIAIAEQKAKDHGVTNVDFRVGTVLDQPSDSQFDVILGLNVVHLIPHYEATLEKCFSLLKPGGVFLQSTACLDPGLRRLKLPLKIGGALRLLPFVNFFSLATLENVMTLVGFQILETTIPGKDKNVVFMLAQKPKTSSQQ